jgi:uncharacterized protein (DUF433 family)
MGAQEQPVRWQPTGYKDYEWIVADPELLGSTLAVRGTRLSVSLVLECLANGMSLDDIDEAFAGAFPREALPEVLRVGAELTGSFHVAA